MTTAPSLPAPSRAVGVEVLALDVDGVLTDGRLHYGPDGEFVKVFDVKDGLGLKLLERAGLAVAVITAKRGPALERRLADLGIRHALVGRSDKGRALEELGESLGVAEDAFAFMGDDVLDLPVLRRVGLAIAPADANFLVRREVEGPLGGWVTQRGGGRGAVREVTDGLLAARGVLESTVAAHLEERGRR
ncbi:MAG: phenylphosphate carboxylase subunit delta [Sandaracinus sp.]|nr:phenylphosphate carboxylase subunit delta [Sandaracinus sp.]